MTPATRTDEMFITQLCEHQPEAVAWFTPVYGNDNGNTGVIIDFEVSYCNIACAEKRGFTKEQTIGQRVLLNGFPDPDIKELKFKQCLSVFETGEPIHYSYFSTFYEKYFMLSRVKVNNGILVTSRDLTDLYAINQEVKFYAEENEKLAQQFQKTVHASANGIVTLSSIRDNEGNIVDFKITQCNEQGFRMGRLPRNAVGRCLLEMMPQLKDVGYFDIHKRVVETGEPFSSELPFNPDNTSEGWYIVSLQKLDDGLVSNFVDVTHIREVESKQMENARELDSIFHTSLTAMYLAEVVRNDKGDVNDMKFLRVNQTFTAITGFSEKELLSNTLLQISPVTKTTKFLDTLNNVLSSGNSAREILYYPNIDRWFEFSMVGVDTNKVSVSFSDITLLKQKERELEHTIEALKRSNDSLEEFTRAASHDLKEPIRKISFFGDQLRRSIISKASEEELHILNRIEVATDRMRLLIDDLLEYSHVNTHAHEKETINLNTKVNLVLNDLELLIKEKNATVKVGELPTIKGNRRQLQQLFSNLISNSLKYSKPGMPPEIVITSKKIKGADTGFELSREHLNKTFYEIEVKDNGIGFDQDDADKIFNVFARLHGNHDYPGNGIGLSIVRKVVENHNGYITAFGEKEAGATFRILLPA